MRAWRVHEIGDPADVLRLEDIAVPEPGPGQVLIEVDRAALNFPDDLMIRGLYQVKPPLPFTPGHEVLGRVVASGPGAVGARAVALAALPAGGFAEYALGDARDVFEVPGSVPDAAAASMLITYQTSHVALHHRARLQPGETLLVHAGAGGVGSSAIQLGVAAGARVLATAGGQEKTELCRTLGAELAIDYSSDDFVAAVLEATDGRGADVIYDPVGGDTFDRSRKCIAWEGRILIIGFAGGRIADAPTNHALLKNYSIVGVHWGAYRYHDSEVQHRAHRDLVELYLQGRIDPVVHAEVALEDMPEGLAMITGRTSVGKVLVRP